MKCLGCLGSLIYGPPVSCAPPGTVHTSVANPVFPSAGSLARLAGAVMCEQDEIGQESRYFSESRMNELYDEGRTRGIDGPVDWARLEAEARKMLESGLELADRVEAA